MSSNPSNASSNSGDNGVVVGIDLGTTNSVVAAVIDGKPHVFKVDNLSSMPSIVGLNAEGKLISGLAARNQLAAFPDRTIASIKRKMGTMDKVSMGEEEYTPPEISAMILRRLRDVASSALGTDVTRAVITVPAYFDEQQRQATRQAGELAGFKVERIINEPTAATLVYHVDKKDRKHIVVYDLGGGTFDVSIVRMEEGVVEVLASQGDTHLGGDDFDKDLLDYVAEEFLSEHGIDLRTEPQSRFRLLQACEQAKIQLSELETVTLAEEFIAEKDGTPLHLKTTISRSTFDDMIRPLIARTIDCVDKALRDASMTIHQMDDLVLVGGSTRIPLVASQLREHFLKEPSRAVDPDLAVGLGAAVQAGMLQGVQVGPVLVDVATHTLSIEAVVGMTFSGPQLECVPIIHRGTALPARYEEPFRKSHNKQERAEIRVFQGEHRDAAHNVPLGELDVKLVGTDESHQKVVVAFNLTLDGILRVTAKQPASGIVEEISIDNALSQFNSEERAEAHRRLSSMFEASEDFTSFDPSTNARLVSEEGAEGEEENIVLDEMQRVLHEAHDRYPKAVNLLKRAATLAAKIKGEDSEELATLSEKLYQAIQQDNQEVIEEVSIDLDDLLFYAK